MTVCWRCWSVFESTIRANVLRIASQNARWLSSGWKGGFTEADAAYNISVPEGWERTDLDGYIEERRAAADFETPGPTLLTGVDLDHAIGARSGSVTVYATAGVSNPATLPTSGMPGKLPAEQATEPTTDAESTPHFGTVNVLVGTTCALDDGALVNLLAVAAEAKAATLLAETGFPGTTTDAVVVGCDPTGKSEQFSGSATPVGSATRACVRDAVCVSIQSRYASKTMPESVADAQYGIVTTDPTEVFNP